MVMSVHHAQQLNWSGPGPMAGSKAMQARAGTALVCSRAVTWALGPGVLTGPLRQGQPPEIENKWKQLLSPFHTRRASWRG